MIAQHSKPMSVSKANTQPTNSEPKPPTPAKRADENLAKLGGSVAGAAFIGATLGGMAGAVVGGAVGLLLSAVSSIVEADRK